MKSEMMKCFGERLKEARTDRKWTQAELAQKANIGSAQMISSYEKDGANGKTPGVDTAVNLARALGVTLDYLCGMDEKDNVSHPISAKEWLQYTLRLIQYPPLNDRRDWLDEAYEIKFCYTGPRTDEDGKDLSVAKIEFFCEDMDRFFKTLDKVIGLRNEIDDKSYNDLLNGLIEKNAKLFEPSFEPFDDAYSTL